MGPRLGVSRAHSQSPQGFNVQEQERGHRGQKSYRDERTTGQGIGEWYNLSEQR